MSHRLQDLFWDVDLTSTEQLVAQRLAWHADDTTGKCWPGIALLCAKTGLGERAVQKSIQSLKAAGHITREENRGLGVIYWVHPRTKCARRKGGKSTPAQVDDLTPHTPAPDAPLPPQEVHPRTSDAPAPDAPTPARRAPKYVKNPSVPKETSSLSVAREPKSTKPHRLPNDWNPERFGPDSAAREVVDRRGQSWAKIQLENFRAWAANADDKPGKGRKLDWQSAFAKWINEQDRQEPRNGTIQRNGSPANAKSADGFTSAIREARAIREAHNDGGMFRVGGVG